MQQIFGGCEKSSMSGNILLQVTGGKITRRIYGGCYNNYTYDGWQTTPNYVYGNILLLLGDEADLELTYGADNTLFAHSRQITFPKKESAHIAFTSEGAKRKFIQKIGPQDGTMKSILGKANAYEELHILSYCADGSTITQYCMNHNAATATVTAPGGFYTGSAIKNVSIELSDNWVGPAPLIEYGDNLTLGLVQAQISAGDANLTVTYFIWPPVWVLITAGVGLLLMVCGVTAFYIIHKKKAAT